MRKIIAGVCFLILLSSLPCFAEKIPIKISPTQIISTHHDETEVGDWISFTTVGDVYIDDNLYIKNDTPILGLIDFVYPNGWMGDYAEIRIKTFKTTDANGKKITVEYPLKIKGCNEDSNTAKLALGYFLSWFFRGAEIFVEPDTKTYNLILTQ